MKYIKEKVAFIEGLAEGLELDVTTKEGKVLDRIIEVLGDITDALDGLVEAQDDLEDYAEMIDDDLTDLEEFILDEDNWDDDDDTYDFSDDDDDYYEVVCPKCGSVYITDFESFEDDEVFCPDCGEQFHLEEKVVNELTQEETCQCGQHHE
ncbi:MAG: transcriptional regulator [Eubacterium sp.]